MVRNYSWASYLYSSFVKEEKKRKKEAEEGIKPNNDFSLPNQLGLQECISYPKTPESYEHYQTAWVNVTQIVLERVELILTKKAMVFSNVQSPSEATTGTANTTASTNAKTASQ